MVIIFMSDSEKLCLAKLSQIQLLIMMKILKIPGNFPKNQKNSQKKKSKNLSTHFARCMAGSLLGR